MNEPVYRKRRRMSEREEAELWRLFDEGLSVREIGRGIGFSHEAVRQRLLKVGMYKPARRQLEEKDEARLTTWYLRGVPIGVIADRLGIAPATIPRVLRRRGVRHE